MNQPEFDPNALFAQEAGRESPRDSLFLLAQISAAGLATPISARVRNLSQGGFLAEAGTVLVVGTVVRVTLPNIPVAGGRVAWAENGRFGVAFDTAIDPQAVRLKPGQTGAKNTPTLVPFSVALARERHRKPPRPV